MSEEKVFISNSKNQKLAAIIHKPDGEGKFPAVILLHGFTGYKEEEHIEGLAKDLSANGYVAIRFDCSGSGESEGTSEGDYRFFNYFKDINEVYKYVCELDFVDQGKIGIWGHSMGGQLSVVYAAANPMVKAVVCVSGTTSIAKCVWVDSLYKEWKRTGWYTKERSSGKVLRIPFAFVEDREIYDSSIEVKKITNPVMVVIGEADDTVEPSDTQKIFDNANEPKELLRVEGMGHDYKKFPEQIKFVNQKVLAFFDKYLR